MDRDCSGIGTSRGRDDLFIENGRKIGNIRINTKSIRGTVKRKQFTTELQQMKDP